MNKITCNFQIRTEQAKLLTDSLYVEKKSSNLSTGTKEALKWIVFNYNHSKTESAFVASDGHKMCMVTVAKKKENEKHDHVMFKLPKITVKDDSLIIDITDAQSGEVTFLANAKNKEGEYTELRREPLLMCCDINEGDRSNLAIIKSYKKLMSGPDEYKNKVVTPRFNPTLLPQYCVEQSIEMIYNGDDAEQPIGICFTKPEYKNTKYILMPLRSISKE